MDGNIKRAIINIFTIQKVGEIDEYDVAAER